MYFIQNTIFILIILDKLSCSNGLLDLLWPNDDIKDKNEDYLEFEDRMDESHDCDQNSIESEFEEWEDITDSNGDNDEDLSIEGLNSKICGISELNRIVGGTEADPKQYPWMAAIMRTNRVLPICGGAIISKQLIVTAAHCLKKYPKNLLRIKLGAHQFSDKPEPHSRDFEIDKILSHERYDDESKENDIAIIKLKNKLKYTQRIKPICLPLKESYPLNGMNCTVTGWGLTKSFGDQSSVLRHVDLKVMPQKSCKRVYSWRQITTNSFCASAMGKDSCQGDSGGPLIILNKEHHWILSGIVSWGFGCARANFPGVYTRVSNYVQWIEHNMKTLL